MGGTRAIVAGLGLALMAHVVSAQGGAVGKVVSAKYLPGNVAEVELKVITGAFYAGSVVDLFDSFDPGARGEGTLTLPQGIDMLMAGDTVKVKITTRGPFPLGTAIAAEKGKFANQAAVMKVVSGGGSAAPAAGPARPQAPAPAKRASLPPACPFTPAELKTALGLDLEAGRPGPSMPFAGGTSLGCDYANRSLVAPSVRVNQIVMDDPAQADPGTYFRPLAGRLEPVPNDPDSAMWQGNQGDLTNATLHYARGGVIVEVRVGMRPSDPAFQAMKQRLAKLRRIP